MQQKREAYRGDFPNDFYITLDESHYCLNLDTIAQEATKRGHELIAVDGWSYPGLTPLEKSQLSDRSCYFLLRITSQDDRDRAEAIASDIIAAVIKGTDSTETLREALAGATGAIATNLRSYVRYNEDGDAEREQPWDYTPDITAQNAQTIPLRDDELEASVPSSQERCWRTASNLIW